MTVYEESSQLKELNEMFISSLPSLPTDVENSIYYPKLKHLLHTEIKNFCREQIELKEDLNFFRMSVGSQLPESEIREYLDGLKSKYNAVQNGKIGIEYHIEVTRVDFGVPVFCMIRRGDDITMKKFVFRFRKISSEGVGSLSSSGVLQKGGER